MRSASVFVAESSRRVVRAVSRFVPQSSIVLFLAALSAGCGASSSRVATDGANEAPIELAEPTVVPLVDDRLPVVRLSLGPHGEIPFVVDTGAGSSMMEKGRAVELGFSIEPYSHAFTSRGSGGGTVESDSYARVGDLSLGDLTIRNLRLPVFETPVFAELGCAGLLGQDILARLVVVFDFPGRQLHLLPSPVEDGLPAYLSRERIGIGDWAQAPLDLRPCPFLSITVEDEPLGDLELDTGAVLTSFPAPVIERLGLEPVRYGTSQGIDGSRSVPVYRMDAFQLYGFAIRGEVRRSSLEFGLLGMDILGQFIFAIDGPGAQLWLHHPGFDAAEGE